MESSFPFPRQDDYALTILTQAANQASDRNNNNNNNNNTSLNSDIVDHNTAELYNKDPATNVKNVTSSASTSRIINQHDHAFNTRGKQSRVPHELLEEPDYNHDSSPRTMEALAFNPRPLERQNLYMNPSYSGIDTQASQNYTNSLGILNAESYDDGRGGLKGHEMRTRARKEKTMPFGMVDQLRAGLDGESDEHEGTTKKRRKVAAKNDSGDDDEEARKKARGRPRVDTKDETAADRRRTQIRMAQRAYRHRKETTISSLEKQVQDLRGTNEEMSNIFINLYDFAVSKGLLQREPEFGQQLQKTTETFLALATSTQDEHNDEHSDDGGAAKSAEPEPETGRRTRARRASPKKRQEATPPVSEPTVPAWGGYEISKDESPVEEIDLGFQQPGTNWRNALQVITRPTEDNASFPFDLMDMQSYRVELPQIDDFSQNFFPESQLPLPKTHDYSEFSFARRIHRAATERAFRLITSNDPRVADRKQQVFGFCLLYDSYEAIEARLRRTMSSTSKDSLSQWQQPFVHVGGAGTYYPMSENDAGDLMPKFRTGFSMGPFSQPASKAQELLENDMRCNLPGFEGQFFDPNDVEGYLRGRGLDIAPAAEFVTGELDMSSVLDIGSPSSDSAPSIVNPPTPKSSAGSPTLNFEPENPFDLDSRPSKCQSLPFPLGFTTWDDTLMKSSDFIDPIFNTVDDRTVQGISPGLTTSDRRTVTVSVTVLLDGECPFFISFYASGHMTDVLSRTH